MRTHENRVHARYDREAKVTEAPELNQEIEDAIWGAATVIIAEVEDLFAHLPEGVDRSKVYALLAGHLREGLPELSLAIVKGKAKK